MWEADLDIDTTLSEYFKLWYGPAAQSAQAYWDALEERMQGTRLLGHEDRILLFVYTQSLVEELEKHQARSERVVRSDPYVEHVRVDRLILEHLKAYMAMHDAYYSGAYGEAVAQADVMFEQRRELTAISSFFHVSEMEYPYSGVIGWGLTERRELFEKLEDMVDGTSGTLVARAPQEMRLSLDRNDLGRHQDWYAPAHDRADWKSVDTGKPFYIQFEETLSDEGIPYTGALWYAFEVDIPKSASGKQVHLYAPLVVPEAWTWVNGEFVGHREYYEAYYRPMPLEHDVTASLRPRETNLVVVRIHTGTNPHWVPEGILGRVFFYAPTEVAQ